jgi:hypothetical protein
MCDRKVFYVADPVTGEDTNVVAVTSTLADPSVVKTVLDAPVGDDGRSEWRWFRFADGTLVLGVFPHGDTYFATERDTARP